MLEQYNPNKKAEIEIILPPKYAIKMHTADDKEAIKLLCTYFGPFDGTDECYFLAAAITAEIIGKKLKEIKKYTIKLKGHETEIFKKMVLKGTKIPNLSVWNQNYYQKHYEEIVRLQTTYFNQIGEL